MIEWILFSILALVGLLSAVQVVRSDDLVHVVLWLALALIDTAGVYVMLNAGFLAAIQLLLYTGGVITLMLFSVMLSRRTGGIVPAGGWDNTARAAVATLAFAAVVGLTLLRGAPPPAEAAPLTPEQLGAAVMNEMALPFEVLSVLLLAAMVGAIVLSRRKDA